MKYCSYCNAELENDAKYCPECGASQEQKGNNAAAGNYGGQNVQTGGGQQQFGGQQYNGYNQQYGGYNSQQQYGGQQYGGYNNQQPYNGYNQPQYSAVPPVKKKNGGKIALGIVCGIIAFFVAFVGAIIIFSDDTKELNTKYTQCLERYDLTDTINKYTIDDENDAVIEKLVLDSGDEFIYSTEYICSGDNIKKSRELMFYDISSLDSFTIGVVEENLKSTFSAYDDVKCCQVSYFTVGKEYFAVMLDIDYSGDKTSLKELYALGVISSQNADYLSCSETIKSKIEGGAISKYIDN